MWLSYPSVPLSLSFGVSLSRRASLALVARDTQEDDGKDILARPDLWGTVPPVNVQKAKPLPQRQLGFRPIPYISNNFSVGSSEPVGTPRATRFQYLGKSMPPRSITEKERERDRGRSAKEREIKSHPVLAEHEKSTLSVSKVMAGSYEYDKARLMGIVSWTVGQNEDSSEDGRKSSTR